MRPCFFPRLFFLTIILIASFAPGLLHAAEFTLMVPTQYATIQAAIDAAAAGMTANPLDIYSVLVEPGTYSEQITLRSSIPLRGRETARTLLNGAGNGAVITALGVTGVTVRNFTIVNAAIGIQVMNNANVSITNNVFQLGNGNTAIVVQAAPSTTIVNNTFYQNGTAISRDSDIIIKNNIFSANTVATSQVSVASNISYNCFVGNGSDGPPGLTPATNILADPLFADPALRNFHLQTSSPAIDTGDPTIFDALVDASNRSDMGAYGGPGMDPAPFPVSGLAITDFTDSSISLTWSPSTDYLVANPAKPGGYKIYYGYVSAVYNGTDAKDGQGNSTPSPIKVGNVTSYTLNGLNPASISPAAPVLLQPEPLDAKLVISWSPSSGQETGYKVHYGIASTSENTIDVGNTTSYVLTGLINEQNYKIAVSSYAQATYYIAVTAYDSTPPPAHESAYSSQIVASIGQVHESGLSNEVQNFPETVAPYPNLPNKGCFIATSAYGNYAAPEVRILRAFRDRYLVTSSWGSALVRFYYLHSPAAARYLDAHPGFKPVVRAALTPAVGVAALLISAPFAAAGLLMLLLGLLTLVVLRKKNLFPSGGKH